MEFFSPHLAIYSGPCVLCGTKLYNVLCRLFTDMAKAIRSLLF